MDSAYRSSRPAQKFSLHLNPATDLPDYGLRLAQSNRFAVCSNVRCEGPVLALHSPS